MADPLDADAREAVARATGKRVEVLAGTEEEIREAIEKAYGEAVFLDGAASSSRSRTRRRKPRATSGWSS